MAEYLPVICYNLTNHYLLIVCKAGMTCCALGAPALRSEAADLLTAANILLM